MATTDQAGTAHMDGDVGDNDWATIARVVIFSAIAPLALLVAPVLTTQLIGERGLSPAMVGNYFLFELGGISFASIPALWWMRRFTSRQIAPVAAVVFILGNLLSIITPSLPVLYGVRLVTALAGGALMLLCLNAAGASANRDRVFGYWISGQLVLGAIGLSLLPRLFSGFGLGAFYGALALMMALALPLAFRFDAPTITSRPDSAASRGSMLLLPVIAMLAVFAFYVGLGGSWAFMSLIAAQSGLAEIAVADTIAVASLLGIAGAFLATFLGGRLPRGRMLLIGYAMLFGAILALLGHLDMLRFAGAAYAFKFAWTFALPFILAAIASRDTGGGIMAWVNLVIGTGTSIGPVITGRILESTGSSTMLLLCAGAVALSLLLLLSIEFGVITRRANDISGSSN